MPGIDQEIAEHKIPIKPGFKPVKQRLRRMHTEGSLKVKKEIDKQFKAGFIKVSEYSDWVANVVPVPKKDGKVRVCMDFRDLNKKLKVVEHEIWDEQCQAAFDKVKEVLSSPPVLSPPVSGLPLSLYLTIHDLSEETLKKLGLDRDGNVVEQHPQADTRDRRLAPNELMDKQLKALDQAAAQARVLGGVLKRTSKARSRSATLSIPAPSSTPMVQKEHVEVTDASEKMVTVAKGPPSPKKRKELFPASAAAGEKTGSPGPPTKRVQTDPPSAAAVLLRARVEKQPEGADDRNVTVDSALQKVPPTELVAEALINIPEHVDSMPVCVERRAALSYVNAIDNLEESETDLWYTVILKYKETGEYPSDLDTRGKRALQMLVAQFIKTDDGQLYKKTAQGVLLRCIDKSTSEKVMEEVHEGECGPHMNAHMLARKIMRLGYYWTTMEADCRKYVRHCHNCKIFPNVQNVPPSMLL
ncbi:uncharacterized protein LOC141620014 [Silene latifolia]|uniref:uncharacterized protein LOC141620014 n=1 Tax=Silene latifolia TaxID=37657 RepID=UPI003D787C0F